MAPTAWARPAGPPIRPGGSRRYGVATEATIFVGKVLNDEGSGTDSADPRGHRLGAANDVRVISMSLGADVEEVSQAYETVGQRALAAGTLIVAAAGNNANRSAGNAGVRRDAGEQPVDHGRRRGRLGSADRELLGAQQRRAAGGEVDIAGPGVAVYSSWPMPTRYNSISGTSMATPHVAGLAALLCQATGATGSELWSEFVQGAQPLDLPAADVGVGARPGAPLIPAFAGRGFTQWSRTSS